MAWERRERGGLYYTRSKRVAGRVVREYLGCGPAARVHAERDARLRAEREALRTQRRCERNELAKGRAAVSAFSGALESLLELALEEGGIHKHKGEWRRRRRDDGASRPLAR
jgi:hypothetical protein